MKFTAILNRASSFATTFHAGTALLAGALALSAGCGELADPSAPDEQATRLQAGSSSVPGSLLASGQYHSCVAAACGPEDAQVDGSTVEQPKVQLEPAITSMVSRERIAPAQPQGFGPGQSGEPGDTARVPGSSGTDAPTLTHNVSIGNQLYLANVTGDANGVNDFVATDIGQIVVGLRPRNGAGGALAWDIDKVVKLAVPDRIGSNTGSINTGHFDLPYGDRESICTSHVARPDYLGDDNRTTCYAMSRLYDPVLRKFSWRIDPTTTTPNLTLYGVVGDFDGDGYDEVLSGATDRLCGATFFAGRHISMYKYQRGKGFAVNANFSLGNMADWEDPDPYHLSSPCNMSTFAGNFFNTPGPVRRRDGVLVFKKETNQIVLFGSATDSSGRSTFHWAFTTRGGILGSNEEITIADANGDGIDDVVLHNTRTGAMRFLSARLAPDGGLVPLKGAYPLNQGQTPLNDGGGERHLSWSRLKYIAGEGGSTNTRDDALIYYPASDSLDVVAARFDGTAQTYWYWYWDYAKRFRALMGLRY